MTIEEALTTIPPSSTTISKFQRHLVISEILILSLIMDTSSHHVSLAWTKEHAKDTLNFEIFKIDSVILWIYAWCSSYQTTQLNVLIFIVFAASHQGIHEKRLLEELFETRKYNKLERPAANDSEPVTVTFGLTLQQIIDVVILPFPFIKCIFTNLIRAASEIFSTLVPVQELGSGWKKKVVGIRCKARSRGRSSPDTLTFWACETPRR